MIVQRLAAACAVAALTTACGSAAMAELAHEPEVAGCKPLGEIVIAADPATASSDDERAAALRKAATDKGATHVVSENGATTSGSIRGQMYECVRADKPPSRSEQRSGF
jgi:hypothetical protein